MIDKPKDHAFALSQALTRVLIAVHNRDAAVAAKCEDRIAFWLDQVIHAETAAATALGDYERERARAST